jgi:hypothetical protein
MSLIELKHHLRQVKMATLLGLCAIFKVEPAFMQPMLDFWIKKGCLRRLQPGGKTCSTPCASCMQCGVAKNEYYEWVID